MVRWLSEQGLDAGAFATEYGHDDDELPGDARRGRRGRRARRRPKVAESVSDAEAARVVVAPEDAPVDDAGA